MKFPGFVGGSYEMDALTFDCQRTINMYPIISESGTSKSVAALVSIPGYELFATVGGGAIRGAKTVASGRAFVVSGLELYEINSDGTGTLRGTLSTATSRVSMAENGTQLMIVDGQYGYIYNMDTNVFAQITDSDFPVCATVTYQDGYFIVPETGTPNFYISALYNGLSWDALDFSNAMANPDNLVSVTSDNGMLWMHGDISTEVFQNTGAAAFPFERVPGAIINSGCADAQTIIALDNSLFWLGIDSLGRGVVWRSQGLSIVRVSTNAIEQMIAASSDLTGSYAYAYHENGHAFYCLNVNGLASTLCFDASTNQWHERTYRDTTTNEVMQHRASCHFFFRQMNMLGDSRSGKIYRQSSQLYSYDGTAIHRERVTPHAADEKRNITFSSLELDVETGVGLQSGQGSDPQIMMQYSNDGGRTWSSERWIPIGAVGQYRTRVAWNRCGSARDRVFRVKYTDPTQFQINDAYLNNG